MYTYTFNANEDTHINTPFCKDFSLVKKEVISQTPQSNKIKTIYPNGFEMIVTQTAHKITIETNYPLIKNINGTYDVQI